MNKLYLIIQGRIWIEDFIDGDTGEVVSVERVEITDSIRVDTNKQRAKRRVADMNNNFKSNRTLAVLIELDTKEFEKKLLNQYKKLKK